jgi:hypothetical protein
MRLDTKTPTITMDQSYKIVNLTIQWGEKFFPPPQIKRRKELLVMIYHSPTDGVYGQYCDKNNWLTINLFNCRTIKDLVQTTIHEHTHVRQNLKEYSLMNKKVGYDRNPFEKQARYNETMYYANCWRSIKNKL